MTKRIICTAVYCFHHRSTRPQKKLRKRLLQTDNTLALSARRNSKRKMLTGTDFRKSVHLTFRKNGCFTRIFYDGGPTVDVDIEGCKGLSFFPAYYNTVDKGQIWYYHNYTPCIE